MEIILIAPLPLYKQLVRHIPFYTGGNDKGGPDACLERIIIHNERVAGCLLPIQKRYPRIQKRLKLFL
jgi:hypothetical protein